MIKRYSHLCTFKACIFIIILGKEQPTYEQFQLEVTYYTMKTSQVKQHFAKINASDARSCLQGEEALQHSTRNLERSPVRKRARL